MWDGRWADVWDVMLDEQWVVVKDVMLVVL